MALGSERCVLAGNPFKRAVIRFLGDTHFGRVLRFLYLKQVLSELLLSPSSILDAGCGQGYTTLYLAKRFPQAHVVGVDLDETSLLKAESARRASHVSNLIFRQHDLQEPLCRNGFDLILSWEVMEYVLNDDVMLTNLYAALHSGGVCLLHLVHAVGGYQRIGARRKAQGATVWRSNGLVRAGYIERELEAKLRRAGFSRVALRPTFGRIGMFAHSLFEVARHWPSPLYVPVFFFLLLLGHMDIRTPKRQGGAILAIAWRD